LPIGSYLGAAICRGHVEFGRQSRGWLVPSGFRDLPRTQPGKSSKCRQKLRTELVVFRDVLNPIDQCDIFGTEDFFQCFNFLEQSNDRFVVFLLVGLRHLLSEFMYIAIGLGFDFVAADDCHDLLCVTLVHLRRTRTLSLRVHRYDGRQQNGDNYLHVHENVPSGPKADITDLTRSPHRRGPTGSMALRCRALTDQSWMLSRNGPFAGAKLPKVEKWCVRVF